MSGRSVDHWRHTTEAAETLSIQDMGWCNDGRGKTHGKVGSEDGGIDRIEGIDMTWLRRRARWRILVAPPMVLALPATGAAGPVAVTITAGPLGTDCAHPYPSSRNDPQRTEVMTQTSQPAVGPDWSAYRFSRHSVPLFQLDRA